MLCNTISEFVEKYLQEVLQNTYLTPFESAPCKTESDPFNPPIHRAIHGAQHACRVAMYIPMLVNLWSRHDSEEAKQFTEEQLLLTFIAALFHDCARNGEGKDEWEKESALACYQYLTETFGVAPEQAAVYAEALVNKDYLDCRRYYTLSTAQNTSGDWKDDSDASGYDSEAENRPDPIGYKSIDKRSFIAKLIHDADCLDVMRVYPDFQIDRLDFYQEIAGTGMGADKKPFDDLCHIILDIKNLLKTQGDLPDVRSLDTKRIYEHAGNVYRQITAAVDYEQVEVFRKYYNEGKILRDTSAVLSDNTIIRYEKNALMGARSIPWPNRVDLGLELTRAAKELKILKDNGINTERSISGAGWHAPTFSDAGLLIFDLNKEATHGVFEKDMYTNLNDGTRRQSKDLAKDARYCSPKSLEALLSIHKLGNTFQDCRNLAGDDLGNFPSHSEILYDITKFDAVFFHRGPNRMSRSKTNLSGMPLHPDIPPLKALYLQAEYEHWFGKKLSIYEYVNEEPCLELYSFSDAQIEKMWVKVCSQYLDCFLQQFMENSADLSVSKQYLSETATAQVNLLKLEAIYYGHQDPSSLEPLDQYYSQDLKDKINRRLTRMFLERVNDIQPGDVSEAKGSADVQSSDTPEAKTSADIQPNNASETKRSAEPSTKSSASVCSFWKSPSSSTENKSRDASSEETEMSAQPGCK